MYREKLATVISTRVSTGRNIECQSPTTTKKLVDLLASKLKMGNESANTWMRMSPRKNTGIEYRMNAMLVAMLSPSEFRLTAWNIPSGRAIRIASSSEMPDNQMLRARRSANREATVWFSA